MPPRTHYAGIKIPSQPAIEKYQQEASDRLRDALAQEGAQASTSNPGLTEERTSELDPAREATVKSKLLSDAARERLRAKAAKLSPQARMAARKLAKIKLDRKARQVREK